MMQLSQKGDNLSHLTRFWVSDLLNCIVYVTAFMLLLGRVHGGLLDLDTPP